MQVYVRKEEGCYSVQNLRKYETESQKKTYLRSAVRHCVGLHSLQTGKSLTCEKVDEIQCRH